MKITIIDVTESDLGVRQVPMNYRSVTGRVQTLDGQTVSFESTLERDLVLLMDFDPRIARITHQPMKIRYRLESGEERSYTLTTWLLLGAVRSGSLHGPYFLRSSIWMNFGIDGATSKRASGPPVWFAHSGVGGFRLSMNATSATTI